jgi:hypothetical protein
MNPAFPATRTLVAACLTMVAAGCMQLPQAAEKPAQQGFSERRALLLEVVAERYQPVEYSDRGKYTFPVVIARMLRHGPEDPRAGAYLDEYASGKYEFFHFPCVGLARVLALFPDAPLVAAHREDFLRRILFHDPQYHYNALTGEGTENHVAMSRTSGYLFAEQAMAYPELRERASLWRDALEEWILDWSHRLYQLGAGEWDSNPYTAYNLIGWLNLHDFADNPRVREAARAVLDFHAANIALKLTEGLHGGPESRGATRYGPLPRSATEYLAWVWFGGATEIAPEDFFKPGEYIQAVHAATSSYRPPAALADLARKSIPVPALYRNTKPDYLMTEPAQVHEVFLIDETFTLGTAQTPLGGWSNASYGLINWKLVTRDPDQIPAVVLGNGGMKATDHARGRNPFDQFFQHDATVVQMTRVPAEAEALAAEAGQLVAGWKAAAARDFAARWGRPHQFHDTHIADTGRGRLETAHLSLVHFPAQTEVVVRGSRAFLRHARTWLALHTLSGEPPAHEPGRLVDAAPRDAVAGFVVEAANASAHPSFEAFMEAASAEGRLIRDEDDPLRFRYASLRGDVMEFRYAGEGEWSEMIYDWGFGVVEQRVGFNSADWRQPHWPGGRNHGRVPEARVNGEPPARAAPGAVIDGPFLSLRDGFLSVADTRGNTYRVDYARRDGPQFTETHGMRHGQD